MEKLFSKPAFLEGKRLLLRELTPRDVSEDYIRWMNDSAIVEFMESRFNIYTRKSLIDYVEAIQKSENYLFFAIIVKEEKKHIGNIKLGPINPHHQIGDIGVLIGEKNYWGKGFAAEAVTLISDFVLHQWNLFKVTAGCYSNNIGSRKVFEKSGFTIEAIRKNQYQYKEERVDELLFGRTLGGNAG